MCKIFTELMHTGHAFNRLHFHFDILKHPLHNGRFRHMVYTLHTLCMQFCSWHSMDWCLILSNYSRFRFLQVDRKPLLISFSQHHQRCKYEYFFIHFTYCHEPLLIELHSETPMTIVITSTARPTYQVNVILSEGLQLTGSLGWRYFSSTAGDGQITAKIRLPIFHKGRLGTGSLQVQVTVKHITTQPPVLSLASTNGPSHGGNRLIIIIIIIIAYLYQTFHARLQVAVFDMEQHNNKSAHTIDRT